MKTQRLVWVLVSSAALTLPGAVAPETVMAAAPSTPAAPAFAADAGVTGVQILQTAGAVAMSLGDPAPTLIQHNAQPVSRAQANRVASGAVVSGDEPSYLVVARGRFSGGNAPRPSGAAGFGGSVLTIVINAATGQVTDTGLGDRVPDLAALGQVATDVVASPAERPSAARASGRQAIGTVRLRVVFAGGPPAPGTGYVAGTVTISTRAGHPVRRVRVAAGHSASVRLRPGLYRLSSGDSSCKSRLIRVRARRRTTADVETGCNIP